MAIKRTLTLEELKKKCEIIKENVFGNGVWHEKCNTGDFYLLRNSERLRKSTTAKGCVHLSLIQITARSLYIRKIVAMVTSTEIKENKY